MTQWESKHKLPAYISPLNSTFKALPTVEVVLFLFLDRSIFEFVPGNKHAYTHVLRYQI